MTPEAIMAAFQEQGSLPREALLAAGQSREAIVPLFLDYIDRLQPLFDVLLDDAADSFVRGEMFETLGIVVLANPDLRPRVTAFLTEFFDLTGTVTGEEVWWAWPNALRPSASPISRRRSARCSTAALPTPTTVCSGTLPIGFRPRLQPVGPTGSGSPSSTTS